MGYLHKDLTVLEKNKKQKHNKIENKLDARA